MNSSSRSKLSVCLYRPLIPQNTGNIARLTAATNSRLDLIKPLGFTIDERNVRRAGLDYWPFVDLVEHECIEDLLAQYAHHELAFFSTKAEKIYTEMPKTVSLLIFGQETKGLPDELKAKYHESLYRIPILNSGVRSLNLANSVAIVLYHQLMAR